MHDLPISGPMQLVRFSFPLAALVACFFSVARAHADVLTLGSNLQAAATITQAHQADAAYWPTTIQGADPTVPADGQVTSIRVKGTVIQPQGAPAPLNEFHFQSLDKGVGDVMSVYLSSGPMDMPYTGDPNQITTFTPDNLCIHKGGVVDLNEEGGWDGTGDGPYKLGSPYRIFGRVPTSSTNWYSKDNGTKNGATLAPPNPLDGTELLMQYTLATGDDRSFDCGGPLRDSTGAIIPTIKVSANQDSYVNSDGSFILLGFCGSKRGDCSNGTATVSINGQPIATAPFSGKSEQQIQITMKLTTPQLVALAAQPGAAWTATVSLSSTQGSATGPIKMHTTAGGLMHVVTPQKVYVRGSRVATLAAFCGLKTGCSGTAALAVKGKVIAKASFATKKKGLVRFVMRIPASILKQLKKKSLGATLSLAGPLGAASGKVTLRH